VKPSRNYGKDIRQILSLYSKPNARKLDSIINNMVIPLLEDAKLDLQRLDEHITRMLEDAQSEVKFVSKLDDDEKKLLSDLNSASSQLQDAKERVWHEIKKLGSQIHTQYGTKDGTGGRDA